MVPHAEMTWGYVPSAHRTDIVTFIPLNLSSSNMPLKFPEVGFVAHCGPREQRLTISLGS